eukprot:10112773-Alexandrium_andersonii.AAC.1
MGARTQLGDTRASLPSRSNGPGLQRQERSEAPGDNTQNKKGAYRLLESATTRATACAVAIVSLH